MVVMSSGALAKITKQSSCGSLQGSLQNQLTQQKRPKGAIQSIEDMQQLAGPGQNLSNKTATHSIASKTRPLSHYCLSKHCYTLFRGDLG